MKAFRLFTLLAALLLMLLMASCNKSDQSGSAVSTSGGTTTTTGGGGQQLAANPATEFSFRTAAGATESVSKYLGKPLVVNFWADW